MSDIYIRGLSKQFGDTKVLQSLDLQVKNGEFLTLLGASGCGKSTLLRLIAGLDQPDSGTIHVGQADLLPVTPSQRDCAMVFQSYALYPHMSVLQNICTPLIMRKLGFWERLPGAKYFSAAVRQTRRDIETTALTTATTLGIDSLVSRKPAQLSGGQRQRVALARAMVRRPSVFLFDEPLSNLDANLRQTLRTEIRQLHKKLGVTFIYVTHDQHEAMSMSDRVAVMREGRILQLGTPEEIYNYPSNLDVARFVGAPRINLISGLVRSDGRVWVQGVSIGRAQASEGACHIAFRPQDGKRSSGRGLKIRGVIGNLEYTGAELIVSLNVADCVEPIVLCVPADLPIGELGEVFSAEIDLCDIHIFDTNGRRCGFEPSRVLISSVG